MVGILLWPQGLAPQTVCLFGGGWEETRKVRNPGRLWPSASSLQPSCNSVGDPQGHGTAPRESCSPVPSPLLPCWLAEWLSKAGPVLAACSLGKRFLSASRGPGAVQGQGGVAIAMSNTDRNPCLPGADLVAKETGNKAMPGQSTLHIHGGLGRGDGSWERREGGAQHPAGRGRGLGRATACSPHGRPQGLQQCLRFPHTTLDVTTGL